MELVTPIKIEISLPAPFWWRVIARLTGGYRLRVRVLDTHGNHVSTWFSGTIWVQDTLILEGPNLTGRFER